MNTLGGGIIGYKKSVFRNLVLISQVGISVMTPIFLCTYFGHLVDKYFHTSIFIIIFLILGVLSGVNLAYKCIKAMLDKEKKEDEKERLERSKNVNKKLVSKPKKASRIFKEDL